MNREAATGTPGGGVRRTPSPAAPAAPPASAGATWFGRRHRIPWWPAAGAVSLGLSLLCARPALTGGDILQVDTVWGPRPTPVQAGFYLPAAAMQHLAETLLGGVIVSRVYVVVALALCALGPMLLLRRRPWYAQLAGAAVGVLNPWVYDRTVEGQWAVVLAAGGLFVWVAAWERLQARPGPRAAVVLGLVGAAVATVDVHTAAMMVVLALAGGVALRLLGRPRAAAWTAVALAVSALLLLPGAVSFLVGSGPGSLQPVRGIDRVDLNVFQSTADPHVGLLPTLLGLRGYWGERIGRFPGSDAGLGWWPLGPVVLVALATMGAAVRRERAWLLVAGLIGIAVAATTAVPGGVDGVAALVRWLPPLAAYREPEKWSVLWLLAVAVLSGEAVAWAGRRASAAGDALRRCGGVGLATLAVAATAVPGGVVMVRDLGATLTPAHYPQGWLAAADHLRSVRGPVAVLPWHQFLVLPFTGRLVGNPAPVVFPGDLILPDDPELPGRPPPRRVPGDIGAQALTPGADRCGLAQALRLHGAHWAVVEPVLDGPEDAGRLLACGFRVDAGGVGDPLVLRDTSP